MGGVQYSHVIMAPPTIVRMFDKLYTMTYKHTYIIYITLVCIYDKVYMHELVTWYSNTL